MGRTRRVALVAIGATTALVMSACSGGSGTSSSKSDEIVLGLPVALSGPFAGFDQPMVEGVKQAVKDINAEGGVDGKKLRVVTANTRSQADQVATAAQSVISKGAQFMIPTQDYDLGGPAARVAEAHQPPIPSITLAGDTRFGLQGIGKHTYNVWQGPLDGAVPAAWAYNDKKLRAPYILNDPTIGYSQSLGKQFSHTWKKLGGKIAGEDNFQNGDASIATQISRLKSAEGTYDFIFLASYPPGGASALRQIRAAGIDVPVLAGLGFSGLSWVKSVPDPSNFFIASSGVVSGGDPDENREAIYDKFREVVGSDPGNAHAILAGYAAVEAYAEAIKRAGSTDTKLVVDELNKLTDFQTAFGSITWTSDCHIPTGQSMNIVEFTKTGKDKLITKVTPPNDIVDTSAC